MLPGRVLGREGHWDTDTEWWELLSTTNVSSLGRSLQEPQANKAFDLFRVIQSGKIQQEAFWPEKYLFAVLAHFGQRRWFRVRDAMPWPATNGQHWLPWLLGACCEPGSTRDILSREREDHT